MAKVITDEQNYYDIADAIRGKLGVETLYLPSDMADAIESIETGTDLTSEDEGKVVVEDEGSYVLAEQTSLSVSENGTYDTTTNDEVVVSVQGSEGAETLVYVASFIPDSNANSAKSGGWKFLTSIDGLKVKGVRMFPRESVCSVFISDANGNVVASKQNVTAVADEWNEINFDAPITLSASTSYVVWGSGQAVAMKYRSGFVYPNLVTLEAVYYSTSYSTFPTSRETGSAFYAVDLIALVQTDANLIHKSITQNGTYSPADDNADGYSEVTVNVSGGGGTGNVGDGNNLIRNSDFSLNTTGLTSWNNTGSYQAPAIDFWHITYASLSVNQDGSVRLARNGGADAYFMQLFFPDHLGSLVGKTVKIMATINGVTYTSVGVLGSSGNSVSTNTPYGTLRVFKYSNYYAVTIDIQNSAAEYIDISGVAFGLEDKLVYPPSLTTKTITQNGTYNASDDNANGYSSVTVNVSGGSVSDNDLLFHFDTDMRNVGKAAAALINSTGMELSDEQSKFGTHSLKFLGTQTRHNYRLEEDLQLGANDFTLDYWMYPTTLSSGSSTKVAVCFDYRSHAIYFSSDRVNYTFAKSSTSWWVDSSVSMTVPTNEWIHIAVVRDGESIYVFFNGTKIATENIGQNSLAPISQLTVGSNTYGDGDRRFNGYLDELRLKIGEAVWTEDFTPPTQPYV